MNEGQPQYSEEEVAEAERFDAMVDEGKITSVEASQIEKDKTPEEVEVEEEAMEKIIIPSDEGYVVHTTILNKIDRVLSQGLITPKLARKARTFGINAFVNSEFDVSPYDAISVYDPCSLDIHNFFIHYEPQFSQSWVTILIKRTAIKSAISDPYSGGSKAYIQTKKRIKPQNFIGLVIDPEIEQDGRDYLLQKAKEARLPLYERFGSLLWPRKMTYEEVKQFVTERDAKKKEKERNNESQ